MKPLMTALALIAVIAHAQDGTIVGWGWNYYGQCNVPSPNQDFVALGAGGST